jgi:hypothetical protein
MHELERTERETLTSRDTLMGAALASPRHSVSSPVATGGKATSGLNPHATLDLQLNESFRGSLLFVDFDQHGVIPNATNVNLTHTRSQPASATHSPQGQRQQSRKSPKTLTRSSSHVPTPNAGTPTGQSSPSSSNLTITNSERTTRFRGVSMAASIGSQNLPALPKNTRFVKTSMVPLVVAHTLVPPKKPEFGTQSGLLLLLLFLLLWLHCCFWGFFCRLCRRRFFFFFFFFFFLYLRLRICSDVQVT